jgi:hypothetical protein
MQEAKVAFGQSVWVGYPISQEPLFEVLCLPHVKHSALLVTHQVNPGMARRLAKELTPEALYQWSRIRK